MAKPYQSSWMAGADALAHVMRVANCDKPAALRQLQATCGDGVVDGRGCGPHHQFNVDRGFDRGDVAWRKQFCTANPSAETMDNYLNTCEFDRASVLLTWPVSETPAGSEIAGDRQAVPDRSGAAGRPSSMHLIRAELERRRSAGAVLSSQAEESAWLSKWVVNEHPRAHPVTAKTIRNSLKDKLREAVAEAKTRKGDPDSLKRGLKGA